MNNRFTFEEEITLLGDMVDAYSALNRLGDIDHDDLEIEDIVENSVETRPQVSFTRDNGFELRWIKRCVYGKGGYGIEKCVEIDAVDVSVTDRDIDEAADKFTSSIESIVNKRNLVASDHTRSNKGTRERLLPFIKVAFREGWSIKVWMDTKPGIYVCAYTPEEVSEINVADTEITDLKSFGGNKSHLMSWGPKSR